MQISMHVSAAVMAYIHENILKAVNMWSGTLCCQVYQITMILSCMKPAKHLARSRPAGIYFSFLLPAECSVYPFKMINHYSSVHTTEQKRFNKLHYHNR